MRWVRFDKLLVKKKRKIILLTMIGSSGKAKHERKKEKTI